MSNVCDVGVDPRRWYPACRSAELPSRATREVVFLGRSFMVYRDTEGTAHCLDNACAHRRVALHEGEVSGCRVVCPYHGWEYDPDGTVARVPTLEPGRPLPRLGVRGFPVVERGGFVWFLPEPVTPMPPEPPDTTEWDADAWFSFRQDRVFPNHYGIGLVNGMDYTHFHLHRKYQPWSDLVLDELVTGPDSVLGRYRITSGRGRSERVLRLLLGSGRTAATVTNPLEVHYDYPHHHAHLGDGLVVWVFFRPEARDRVAVYITLYLKARPATRRLRQLFEPFFRKLVLARIQEQDAWIGELEQVAWETRPDEPRSELNPVASAAERLLRSRWRDYVTEVSPPADRWPAALLDVPPATPSRAPAPAPADPYGTSMTSAPAAS
ncbi:Rieske 2Fe-2S domain-containing protein [Streptomyces sp. NPDC090106]|uniref:Rieske 2Fe-2S domain-containing protein n=1 Tax=Streptomyces sp. NPDC090106 TaxID=3365946 RepID=UPI0038193247